MTRARASGSSSVRPAPPRPAGDLPLARELLEEAVQIDRTYRTRAARTSCRLLVRLGDFPEALRHLGRRAGARRPVRG